MKYGELTLGQIEAVVNKLGGMTGVAQLLAEEVVVTAKTGVQKPQNAELETEEMSPRNLGITVPAQPECTVAACFTNKKVFAYHDVDFDNWFPATLPASAEVSAQGYELTKITTEAEMAKVGKPFTNLLQIEDLILRTEKGEDTGLITNGYANLFFLEVGRSVFTVYAYRSDDGWRVNLYRFSAGNEWDGGGRFFSSAT